MFPLDGSAISKDNNVYKCGVKSIINVSLSFYIFSKVLEMTCNKSCSIFAEGKRQKQDPMDMTSKRKAVQECLSKTHGCVSTNCVEEYNNMITCMTDNPRHWAQCVEYRRALDKCAVKFKCGELSPSAK